MIDNPSSAAMGSRAAKSSLPKDLVNRLNSEIKALKEIENEADSVGSRRGGDFLPNVSVAASSAVAAK